MALHETFRSFKYVYGEKLMAEYLVLLLLRNNWQRFVSAICGAIGVTFLYCTRPALIDRFNCYSISGRWATGEGRQSSGTAAADSPRQPLVLKR
jgi:hypothetical protein